MKRALILSGGGSRGAYEIGAWQAFTELGVRFHAVYGTSIGALNAALFAQGDLQSAVDLWSNITIRQVMVTDDEELSIDHLVSRMSDIVPFLVENARHLQADITPLVELIDTHIDEAHIRASGLELGVMTTTVPQLTACPKRLRDMKPGTLRDWIIASASAFPVFPIKTAEGGRYVDGGFCDNLPIDMALEDGADELVAVDVHPVPVHPDYEHAPFVRIIHPLHNLGGFLDFNPKLMRRTRLMGYYDTMKAYSAYEGIRYTFLRRPAAKAQKFVLDIARFDSAVLTPRRGSESDRPPLMHALSFETPARALTYKEMYLRGLELCARAVGFREDALYDPDVLTKQIAGLCDRTDTAPLSAEGLRSAAAEGNRALLPYVVHALRNGDLTQEQKQALAEYAEVTAAALWLNCVTEA